MKNKTIPFKKWLSSRCLDAHLAKTLAPGGVLEFLTISTLWLITDS